MCTNSSSFNKVNCKAYLGQDIKVIHVKSAWFHEIRRISQRKTTCHGMRNPYVYSPLTLLTKIKLFLFITFLLCTLYYTRDSISFEHTCNLYIKPQMIAVFGPFASRPSHILTGQTANGPKFTNNIYILILWELYFQFVEYFKIWNKYLKYLNVLEQISWETKTTTLARG